MTPARPAATRNRYLARPEVTTDMPEGADLTRTAVAEFTLEDGRSIHVDLVITDRAGRIHT